MSPCPAPDDRGPARWLAGVFAVLVLLPGLGATDLWAPDEPRYAQVAEEMRSFEHGAGGVLLLHLNGEAYTQKPPLYYWLAAALGSASGHVGELAARLPSALAAVACVVVVQCFGARLFSLPGAGALSALILLTTLRFAHQARRAQLDVLLTLFELMAVASGWMLARSDGASPRRRRRWLIGLHGAVGLALLTKGPVGALPYLVLTVHLAWEGRLGAARRLFPVWGLALALAPIAGWLTASVALAPPGFFGAAVLDNVLARFFSGTDHVRPFYYYAYQLPLDLLPWTPWLVIAFVQAWRRQRRAGAADTGEGSDLRLLLAWVITFAVFFSYSSGKRGLYLLPSVPAFALLGGWGLARALAAGRLPRGLELCGNLLVAGIGVAGAALVLAPSNLVGLAGVAPFGWALAVLSVLYAATALWIRRRSVWPGSRLVGLVAVLCAFQLALFIVLFPALDAEKSPRPLAEAVTALTGNRDEGVGVFRHSALTGGLEYYSGHRVLGLETHSDLERFVAQGRRIVVARRRHADEVVRVVGGTVRAALRHGSREIVVIEADPTDSGTVPVPPSGAPPEADATPGTGSEPEGAKSSWGYRVRGLSASLAAAPRPADLRRHPIQARAGSPSESAGRWWRAAPRPDAIPPMPTEPPDRTREREKELPWPRPLNFAWATRPSSFPS